MAQLLTRDAFREAVFARDRYRCVFCSAPAQDAHHILERRLWEDGGYYLDNGASVCGDHHRLCEMTVISVEQVREACGISKPIIPPHLYGDDRFDKWGNPILANGQRLRGELFDDESVQKILRSGGVLDLFTQWVKYPRTFHLPWSPGMHDDDRMMGSLARFSGQRVIVQEKMDGENTTMYSDHIHARSVESRHDPSQAWVKGLWGRIAYEIPDRWRICVENLYARHSIPYDDLPAYALGFAIWNEHNECLPWDDTREYLEMLGIVPMPVLYDGVFDEAVIRHLYREERDWSQHEGYVVRLAGKFHYRDFRHCVGKYVRRNHVQTTSHWRRGQPLIPNKLRG